MASSDLVRQRYATALLDLATAAGETARVESELAELEALLQESADLRLVLASPKVARSKKKTVLLAVMGDGVSDVLRRTLLLMTDKGRADLIEGFGLAYQRVSMAASGREVAQVTSARPLDDAARSRLVDQLARVTGKQITIQEDVDESLLGGVRVIVGSRMIDGSLRRRLEALRGTMLAAPLTASGS